MSDFLVEFLTEEIPARMQLKACEELLRLLTDHFEKLDLSYKTVETYVTPRRLVGHVIALDTATKSIQEKKRGPRIEAPEKALQGFLISNNITKEQCVQEQGYWYGIVAHPARPTEELLPQVINQLLKDFVWPKSMRWAGADQMWVRPLRNVLALYNGKALEFEIPGFNLTSRAITYGHRFLGKAAGTPLEILDFKDYKQKLAENYVVLCHKERQDHIRNEFKRLAAEKGCFFVENSKLLEEVAGLVEYPQPLLGDIQPEFLSLPRPVLETSMAVHQKYFSFEDAQGNLLPYFGLVANTIPADKGQEMLRGYRRVLAARLSDAVFFDAQDMKYPLETYTSRLETIVFHGKLGSLRDRVRRLQALMPTPEGKRAALLCKADLVTNMVREFPELQGIMGENYAARQGESAEVAQAIRQHYQPQGAQDCCPAAPLSISLALADKLDTLVGFFGIGEMPTGSKDPFALRRAALGVIRIILENRLENLSLMEKIEEISGLYKEQGIKFIPEFTPRMVMDFILERLSHMLRQEGYAHDVVAAVLSTSNAGDNIFTLMERVSTLQTYLVSESGEALKTAFRRAYGILFKEKDLDHERGVLEEAFVDPAEKNLYDQLEKVSEKTADLLKKRQYKILMDLLASLSVAIDGFFNLKINHENQNIKGNRFALLKLFISKTSLIADFSKLEG